MRPNILYLVHRFPFPPDKGDRIRNFHVLKFLSRRAALYVACLADEPVEEWMADELRTYCQDLAIVRLGRRTRWLRALGSAARGGTLTEGAFRSPAFQEILQLWARRIPFQSCIASASSVVPYLQIEELRNLPVVIDLVDVDSQKWLDYAADSHGPRAWMYRTEGQRLRRLEREFPSGARAVTLVSEAEASLYRRFCRPGAVQAIPNGVDLNYFQQSGKQVEQACVFVGALDYRPNIEGADWFCRNIWPMILQKHPQTKMDLVGRRPGRWIRRLAQIPGVHLIGQVADVRGHLERAAVVVAPLRLARGLQNKVLEGLAMGKAVVATPQAVAGLSVEPEVHLLTASSVLEWSLAVGSLLESQSLREKLGDAGRKYVEEHHRWEICLQPFLGLLGLPADPELQDKTSARKNVQINSIMAP